MSPRIENEARIDVLAEGLAELIDAADEVAGSLEGHGHSAHCQCYDDTDSEVVQRLRRAIARVRGAA